MSGRDLLLNIDRSLGRRVGLEQALRDAIRSGRLVTGAAMPSTRSLAADQGLSRSTVVAAYEQLATEGYLVVRQGAATTVADLRSVGSSEAERTDAPRPLSRSEHVPAPAGSIGVRSTGLGAGQLADFRPGEPDSSLFPRSAWLRSVKRAVSESDDSVFSYGDVRGHPILRSTLAGYLGRARAVHASADSISIFSGATGSLGFIGEAFRRLDIDAVAMEEPGPFLLRGALELADIRVVPVPVDDEGIRVDALAEMDVGAVVVTPANQYPTGVTMSAARRAELLRWANEKSGWIVEDDYDGEFRYDRQTIGALQGLDPDRVLYVGTASKSLSPALRLSWVVVPPELEAPLGAVKHLRGAPSTVDQVALADFIDSGSLDRHLRQVRKIYERRQLMVRDLVESAAPWARVPSERAGLHLCATVDGQSMSERTVLAAARACGVRLLGLAPHWTGPPAREGVVLGFTRLPEHGFSAGVERLAGFLADVGR